MKHNPRTAGLRETKKARTRGEILATARELFLRRGFEATRIADIARRLQVSEQTVFNYFPSKPAIVEGLLEQWLAENARDAGATPAPRAGSILEGARLALGLYLLRLAPQRDFIRLLVEHSSLATLQPRGPAASASINQARAQIRISAEMYRAAQRAGEVRAGVDPGELAELLFYVMGWSLRTWVDTEPAPDLLELAFRRFRIVMAGALAGPAPDFGETIAKVRAAARAAHP